MSTHLYPEVAAHLMRVTDTAHWLEWQDWANPVLAGPFELNNGHLTVPDRPGHGIAWNEKAVAKFALCASHDDDEHMRQTRCRTAGCA